MSARVIAACLVCACATLVTAQERATDEQRSAWRYRREVTAPAGAEGRLWAVPLPPDVQSRSQPRLVDVRLVDDAGRDVPFLLHEDTARRGERRWSGALIEAQRERRQASAWTVDFGALITFDRLVLDMPGREFTTRMTLEVSSDNQAWQIVDGDFWAFDRVWQSQPVHDTTLELGTVEARFVRVTAGERRSGPVAINGMVAVQTSETGGASWSEDVPLELIRTADGRTRYRVPVADGHPARRLFLEADDPAFARTVGVFERTGERERQAGSGHVYRLRLPDEGLNIDELEIDVDRQTSGALEIEVHDGDNPPLSNPRVRLAGPRTLLVTSTTGSRLTLYYGNSVTRPAVYDLEQLRTAIAMVAAYPAAELGPEVENPRFRQPPPLAFVAARGAAVQSSAWRFERPLHVTGAEDLYTLLVPPSDLSRLRRDLGDLRVVDDADRQVPYVLQADADVAHVTLAADPATPRQGRTQVSAFRLRAPDDGGTDAPRLAGLRLQFAEPYFERAAEVLVPRAGAPLGADSLTATTITVPRREAASTPVWVHVRLPDADTRELLLEIVDRDNAPLTLLQAQGLVRVPRVTFKAGPGSYRLLLGNAGAERPSYELGALRQEVLAYSAVPLTVDAAVAARANPAYERGVADVLRDAPPRAVLWSALGVAVLVLLVLTRRILTRGAEGR